MGTYPSPLRYPGGKGSLFRYLSELIQLNKPIDCYIEPFAGGAAAALSLLLSNQVKKIILNDHDKLIYHFWDAVINNTELLIHRIENTPVNLEIWNKQREFLKDKSKLICASSLDIGFAAFYLNRCNRSGILIPHVGPIGGRDQKGKWKIDCRFNKSDLIERIKRIADHRDRIEIFNLDGLDFLKHKIRSLGLQKHNTLLYLDPPYYKQGPELYNVYFTDQNHIELMKFLRFKLKFRWVLSYDDVPEIRKLYAGAKQNGFSVNHFAYKAKIGRELIISSDNCLVPNQ
jgi:DNA adenine methylase